MHRGTSGAAGGNGGIAGSSPDSRPRLAALNVKGMSHTNKPAPSVAVGIPNAPDRRSTGSPAGCGTAGAASPVSGRNMRRRVSGSYCDGSEVLIRPVQSTDAALLADGFARLSPQSLAEAKLSRAAQVRLRFGSAGPAARGLASAAGLIHSRCGGLR